MKNWVKVCQRTCLECLRIIERIFSVSFHKACRESVLKLRIGLGRKLIEALAKVHVTFV
jgi:hypothetical protein